MMALAGRAAIRIGEAIGWPASTIAAFLKGVKAKRVALGPESLVVVDEASMLDQARRHRGAERALPPSSRSASVGIRPGAWPRVSRSCSCATTTTAACATAA